MKTSIEYVREDLSKEQRDNLVKILEHTKFKFVPAVLFDKHCRPVTINIGWVDVKEPKPDHPKFSSSPLPIGFIGANSKNEGKYYAKLVNTDKKFSEDYHPQLREIYLSV